VNTSVLEQELAPLNAQVEQIRTKRVALEDEMRVVEEKLATFADDRQRFDALGNVCEAFDKLGELKADDLFWKGIQGIEDAAGHLGRVRGRIARFEMQIHGILEKQTSLQEQIDQLDQELDLLLDEIHDAYDREERRKEEFVIEREILPDPHRAVIMPWTKEAESEKQFRRALVASLLFCIVFGSLVPLIKVPVQDRITTVVEIPERLAKLVKKEPPAPQPQPQPQIASTPPKEEPQKPKDEPKPQPKKKKTDKPSKKERGSSPKPSKVAAAKGGGASAARKKAERVGIMAFKEAFADLMDETPIAKLGTEARLSKESPRVSGQAVAQRSLVAIQAQGGSSGGIGNARISRNVGSGNGNGLGGGGIGRGGGSGNGAGFEHVESSIVGLEESSRPLSDGASLGRTDEEIQIVFDRYKATLYRIYNKELRKDPTLSGKILLRISIEENGEVSMCKVESTDLASPELVAMIVARIEKFNFGPKEGVPKITVLYPIDFLPAG